jgi:EpsI family protein
MSREGNAFDARALAIRVFVVAASLLAAGLYLTETSKAEVLPPRESLAKLPMSVDKWVGRREPDFSKEILAELRVDDYIVRSYTQPTQGVLGLYIGYHSSQRQGTAIHSPLNCLPGAGWIPVELGRAHIQVKDGATGKEAPIEVNRVIIEKGLDRQLVFYWYQSHRRVVASEYWGKIYSVVDAVRYNRTDAALVRVVVPIPDEVPIAKVEEPAIRFVQSLFPLLSKHLPT